MTIALRCYATFVIVRLFWFGCNPGFEVSRLESLVICLFFFLGLPAWITAECAPLLCVPGGSREDENSYPISSPPLAVRLSRCGIAWVAAVAAAVFAAWLYAMRWLDAY